MIYLDRILERRLLGIKSFAISTKQAVFTMVESAVASHPMETEPELSVFLVKEYGRLVAVGLAGPLQPSCGLRAH